MQHGKARGPRDLNLLVRSSVLYFFKYFKYFKYLRINNSISRPLSRK